MATYEKEVRDILSLNQCTFVRHGKGDHDIWYSPKTGNKFALSRHGKQEVPTGMERKARKVLLGE